jgi:hypothetical protein
MGDNRCAAAADILGQGNPGAVNLGRAGFSS